jgi:bis(5'-nucleosyl)-tetraphosphatase (symmetrical)
MGDNVGVATYALGDVQGCARTLDRLLERIAFDPACDQLWSVGDLVNRGPDSLAVLRRVRGLGAAATVVLGNHDLHLLARAAGVRGAEPEDTLEEVLAAGDRDELMDWLAGLPLLVRRNGLVLVHAGIPPSWTVSAAERHARDLETALRKERQKTLALLGAKAPARWTRDLDRAARLRFTARALTRLRLVTADGRIAIGHKGPPETAPNGSVAWFDAPGRRSAGATILCGHWAALGFRMRKDLLALDSACVWGGSLTAVRLEDRAVFQVPCADREAGGVE